MKTIRYIHGSDIYECVQFNAAWLNLRDWWACAVLCALLSAILVFFPDLTVLSHIMTNRWVDIKSRLHLIQYSFLISRVVRDSIDKDLEKRPIISSGSEKYAQLSALKAVFCPLTRGLKHCHATKNRGGGVQPRDTAVAPPSHNLAYASQPPVLPPASARKQSR